MPHDITVTSLPSDETLLQELRDGTVDSEDLVYGSLNGITNPVFRYQGIYYGIDSELNWVQIFLDHEGDPTIESGSFSKFSYSYRPSVIDSLVESSFCSSYEPDFNLSIEASSFDYFPVDIKRTVAPYSAANVFHERWLIHADGSAVESKISYELHAFPDPGKYDVRDVEIKRPDPPEGMFTRFLEKWVYDEENNPAIPVGVKVPEWTMQEEVSYIYGIPNFEFKFPIISGPISIRESEVVMSEDDSAFEFGDNSELFTLYFWYKKFWFGGSDESFLYAQNERSYTSRI